MWLPQRKRIEPAATASKQKYFGHQKAAVALQKVTEGLCFVYIRYSFFTVFAFVLHIVAFRRIFGEKLNV